MQMRTVQETSKSAYRNYQHSPRRMACIKSVLAFVNKYPGHTSYEICVRLKKYERHDVSSRLSELLKAGCVENGITRVCKHSKKTVKTWYPV